MAKVKYKEISPELESLASPTLYKNSRVSIGFEKEVGEFYYFSTEDLIPYKNQARTIFDEEEIYKLSETIKEHGIRQPLTVLKSEVFPDKYEVVSGERRLRAAKLIGLEKVPCIIIRDKEHADEISLIENIQRQDLHPLELARAINTLLKDKPYGKRGEFGRKIGLSRSQVSELLSLLSFSQEIQDILLEKNVRVREHFRRLLALKSDSEQLKYLSSVVGDENGHVKAGNNAEKKRKSRSIIRLSILDGALKVQSYSLRKISQKEKEDVRSALLHLLGQLADETIDDG